MTELERARAHLLARQNWLAFARRNEMAAIHIDRAELNVLAALSWVWEEQRAAEKVFRFLGDRKGGLEFGTVPRGREVV